MPPTPILAEIKAIFSIKVKACIVSVDELYKIFIYQERQNLMGQGGTTAPSPRFWLK